MEALKQSIMANQFASLLRDGHKPDAVMFEELCSLLKELSSVWHSVREVDKELVKDLFEQHGIIYGNLMSVEHSLLAQQEREMVYKIEQMIRDCLS